VIERARLVELGWDAPLEIEPNGEDPPEPTGELVLVEVEACGVCHRDLIDRAGRFPFQRVPITPGHEAVGRVIATGEKVTRYRRGDRVATMHRDACGECDACVHGDTSLCGRAAFVLGILADGGYASRLLVPESALYPAAESMPAAEAAVLHCTFGTAYRDLVTLGRLRAGERVLVTGANGGVGTAAIQIATRLGAEVTAVVRDARHETFVRSLGARRVIVAAGAGFHRDPSLERCDLALEAVGAPTFNSSLRSLRIGGRIVVVGNVVPEPVSLNLGYMITNGLSLVGGSGATRTEMRDLLTLHAREPFQIPIDRVLPIARADEAQRLVRAGGLEGRIVLVPSRAEAA
jgi:acryloyl-coenzyme A reductase